LINDSRRVSEEGWLHHHVAFGSQAHFVDQAINPMTHAHDTGLEIHGVSIRFNH
jgi:hypothetical protein